MSSSTSNHQKVEKTNGNQGSKRNGRGKGREKRSSYFKDPDVNLSRSMSRILRHQALNVGLKIRNDGFVKLDDLLSLTQFKNVTVEDIKRVVQNDEKKRYKMIEEELDESVQNQNQNQNQKREILWIRANQGHSIKNVTLNDMRIISSALEVENCIHGTYYGAWKSIKVEGLSRMKRNHIHFAVGLPKESSVISGMRGSSEILIYLDLELALKDGFEFYLSDNHVVLSPGNSNGVIDPYYFKLVLDAKSKQPIPFTKVKLSS